MVLASPHRIVMKSKVIVFVFFFFLLVTTAATTKGLAGVLFLDRINTGSKWKTLNCKSPWASRKWLGKGCVGKNYSKNYYQPVAQDLIVGHIVEMPGKWPSWVLRRSNQGEVHSLLWNRWSTTQDDWQPFDPPLHPYQELALFDFRDLKRKGTEKSYFIYLKKNHKKL